MNISPKSNPSTYDNSKNSFSRSSTIATDQISNSLANNNNPYYTNNFSILTKISTSNSLLVLHPTTGDLTPISYSPIETADQIVTETSPKTNIPLNQQHMHDNLLPTNVQGNPQTQDNNR
jgi:ribosomal protein L31